MANNEDLLHDINIVTTLSSKYDFKNTADIDKILKFCEAKKPFKTQIGALYRQRLSQKRSGTAPEACFLCRKNTSYDGVLCQACMDKYTKGTRKFITKTNDGAGKALSDNNIQKIKEDLSSKANTAQDKLKKFAEDKDLAGKAQSSKEKAMKFAEENKLDEKADIAKKKTANIIKRLKFRWNRLSRKQQLIISVAGVLVLALIIGTARHSSKSGATEGDMIEAGSGMELDIYHKSDGSIQNLEDAEKTVEKLFPQSEGWNILSSSDSMGFKGEFWTPVGYSTGYAEQVIEALKYEHMDYYTEFYEQEPHYTIYITRDNSPDNGYVILNDSGRILLDGDFPDLSISGGKYRVK